VWRGESTVGEDRMQCWQGSVTGMPRSYTKPWLGRLECSACITMGEGERDGQGIFS
jgi:hypothetical protein